MMNEKNQWVFGIDVGGTFTDLVAVNKGGKMVSTKTPSTPDQSDGVMNGIKKMAEIIGIDVKDLLVNGGASHNGRVSGRNRIPPRVQRKRVFPALGSTLSNCPKKISCGDS